MSTTIICPNCNTPFEPEAAIAKSIEESLRKDYNQKWNELAKQKDDELKQKEQVLQKQYREQAQKMENDRKAAEEAMATRLKGDFENQIKILQETNRSSEAKLTEARQKELEFLKQMQQLKTREQELELEIQRKLVEERSKLAEVVKKEEEEKNKLREAEFQMKLREKDMQLEAQHKLVEEMRRKAEQGSMQMQGEAQELELEEMLKSTFPFDVVSEVGKGVRGADCIQTIRNNYGQECGKIIYESKRTQAFSEEWIEKLKADMRSQGADVAVLVTQTMPKGMEYFGERNGVWICDFADVKALVYVLRDLVLRVYTAGKSQENKGDKMTLLYNYLVSAEFAEQWRAIREGFMGMKVSIQKERDQMEKLWKAREKQLEKVLLNAAHIRGSIEGISGMEVDLTLLPEEPGYPALADGTE